MGKTLEINVPSNISTVRLNVAADWRGTAAITHSGRKTVATKTAGYLSKTGRWMKSKPGRKSKVERAAKAKGKA